MPDVRSMCAIGTSGQLGLNGHLPWEGDKRPEFRADVARFFDVTRGHVLMAGAQTIADLKKMGESGGVPPELAATLARFLVSDAANGLSGRLISAVYDDWSGLDDQRIAAIMQGEAGTLRRVALV